MFSCCNLGPTTGEALTITEIPDPHIASYTSYLHGVYTSMSHSHTSQHWTHLPQCEFIQLAMITNESIRRGGPEEEMVRLAQQGNIETIMVHKNPVELDDLFAIEPHPGPLVVLPSPSRLKRVLLIEGAPGGGKSTLALHICHKWAQGASFLARFDVVVLAYLRDQAIQNATALAEILPGHRLETSQTVASRIQHYCGYNVLFIFDGWDEFPSDLQKKSLVSTIINRPDVLSLHQSTVLITSRPVSSGNLFHIANQRVEILGFTRYQIHQYFKKALGGNEPQIQKLVQHLEYHPVIEGYCYIPLHAAILVHIFLTMKGVLPTTLHELFHYLVLCRIVCELETHESVSDSIVANLSSLDDLSSHDRTSHLIDLCKLAYHGVIQNKIVFYQKDLLAFKLPVTLPSMGLLQAVEGLTLFSKSLSYNFLHLSIQELLGAYHISKIDSTQHLEVFKKLFQSSRFQPVLQYYSGFTRLDDPLIQRFISSYSQTLSQKKFEDILPLLHCFFQAQRHSLCKLINHQLREIQLDDRLQHLNPIDFLVVGYFITSLLSTSSSDDPVEVHLKLSEVDDHSLKLLLSELSKYSVEAPLTAGTSLGCLKIEMRQLNFSPNRPKLLLVASHLRQSPAISELSVCMHYGNRIDEDSLLHLAEALQINSSLTKLKLKNMELLYTQESGPALIKMLQRNKSLTHLFLSKIQTYPHNHLKTFPQFIFEGLQNNDTLVYLDISQSMVVSPDGFKALHEMLTVNKTLKYLNLSRSSTPFSDSGAHCIFKGLQQNKTLVYLNVHCTGITVKMPETAQALTKMLQVNKSLKHLDMSVNPLALSAWDSDYYWLLSLKNNDTLEHLNLSNTGITDKGATHIAHALVYNTALQKLNISCNAVKDVGFACIVETLKLSTLKHLNIRCNSVYKNNCILTVNEVRLRKALHPIEFFY